VWLWGLCWFAGLGGLGVGGSSRWVVPGRRGSQAYLGPRAAGAEWSCYHPSQPNTFTFTFTGRVTSQMLNDIFTRARNLADLA
jgi:hypothetical protein